MEKASEMMTTHVVTCTLDTTVAEAARLMLQHHVGCLPVVDANEGERMVGIVTDRDIVVRAVAYEHAMDTPVWKLMSTKISTCQMGDDVHVIENIMVDRRVRRVPVVDEQGRCVGIISQADLAAQASTLEHEELLHTLAVVMAPTPEERDEEDSEVLVA